MAHAILMSIPNEAREPGNYSAIMNETADISMKEEVPISV